MKGCMQWNLVYYLTGTAVAFSVWLGVSRTSTTDNEIVVFDQIVTNIGSAYSATTGQFTTPVDGV